MFALEESDIAALAKMAKEDGKRTKSSLIRKFIREAAKNGGH